jgi:putative endonuclease
VSSADWFVYILSCSDKSFYCGIAKNVQKRLQLHNQGKGAKFTRGRTPCVVVWQCSTPLSHGDALRLERRIKLMSRLQKENMIASAAP